MLPHNKILGHLLQAKDAIDDLPPGAHSMYIMDRMSRKLGRPDALYFDPWPIGHPFLIINDPYLAVQVTSHPVTGSEKPPGLDAWFLPITGRGGWNLFTENGSVWKQNNSLFLPFFNNNNLDAILPVVLRNMVTLRDILRQKAQIGDMFRLEPLTLALMNDISGRILFNEDLGNLAGRPHPISKTMLRQLGIKSAANVVDSLRQLNPFEHLSRWNNGRILDNHIRAQVHKQLNTLQNAKTEEEDDGGSGFKTILGQALKSYYAQTGKRTSEPPDEEFMKMLVAQLRMFFFAGYDSTSSAMVSSCYLLWKHPEALAKVRAEHDRVLGPDPTTCADRIAENPSVLNALTYTTAVIKEAMRLFPPASGVRAGCADLVLRGRDGTTYPTAGVTPQINHLGLQRNPAVWPRALEFLPERFMVGAGDALHPPAGAWRAFEHGVRSCTGQAFVMKELRAFLALLAREFDLRDCYDEVYAGEDLDLTHVDGEKAYMIEAGSAHPRGQMPVRVSLSGYTPPGADA